MQIRKPVVQFFFFFNAFPFFGLKWVYHKLYIFQFQIFDTNWPSLPDNHLGGALSWFAYKGLSLFCFHGVLRNVFCTAYSVPCTPSPSLSMYSYMYSFRKRVRIQGLETDPDQPHFAYLKLAGRPNVSKKIRAFLDFLDAKFHKRYSSPSCSIPASTINKFKTFWFHSRLWNVFTNQGAEQKILIYISTNQGAKQKSWFIFPPIKGQNRKSWFIFSPIRGQNRKSWCMVTPSHRN